MWMKLWIKMKHDQRGLTTVEIVVILAVLVGIALLFKNTVISFVTRILTDISNTDVQSPSSIATAAPVVK